MTELTEGTDGQPLFTEGLRVLPEGRISGKKNVVQHNAETLLFNNMFNLNYKLLKL